MRVIPTSSEPDSPTANQAALLSSPHTGAGMINQTLKDSNGTGTVKHAGSGGSNTPTNEGANETNRLLSTNKVAQDAASQLSRSGSENGAQIEFSTERNSRVVEVQ